MTDRLALAAALTALQTQIQSGLARTIVHTDLEYIHRPGMPHGRTAMPLYLKPGQTFSAADLPADGQVIVVTPGDEPTDIGTASGIIPDEIVRSSDMPHGSFNLEDAREQTRRKTEDALASMGQGLMLASAGIAAAMAMSFSQLREARYARPNYPSGDYLPVLQDETHYLRGKRDRELRHKRALQLTDKKTKKREERAKTNKAQRNARKKSRK